MHIIVRGDQNFTSASCAFLCLLLIEPHVYVLAPIEIDLNKNCNIYRLNSLKPSDA